jgi:hypothetical protein
LFDFLTYVEAILKRSQVLQINKTEGTCRFPSEEHVVPKSEQIDPKSASALIGVLDEHTLWC